jgi:hypothetical protein
VTERRCPHCCKPIREHVMARVGLRCPDTPAPPQARIISLQVRVSGRALRGMQADPGAFVRWAEAQLEQRSQELAREMLDRLV